MTLLAQAELRAATGRPADATALLGEARAVCERLGARPTLGRIDTIVARLATGASTGEAVTGLTPRELDVLRLVAQGLTDAEVAGRLFISPRTVSQHLRSVYGKLDVSSRSGATRFAVEHHLT
ncbi:MAG: response regulator transcription factor [Chloroflexia bacterium]|nr:response regulator transcription factor [Chloroflexia bacterium]